MKDTNARAAAALAAIGAAAVCCGFAVLWSAQYRILIDQPWLASLGSRFALSLDALAAPLVVFVTGLAVPILAYTAAYLPHHLKEEGRKQHAMLPFVALMTAFMLAMVLLILAQDLFLIFLALELTALCSFLLIRFDEHKPAARRAALVALVVTAGSSLLFLAGVLIVAERTGTTALADLMADGVAAEIPPVAALCLAAGVLAKSAQVPLHFWLPRAMVAPTPVSAYLHSATLVAAGVFVLQRLRFLLEASPLLLDVLFWFAFLSIGIGALLALTSDEFKRILAYSTIAQYGYAVALIAAGGAHGAVGAPFFLAAHGLAKCALFMTAGAVTTATGQDRLSQSGGLARQMPLLAASSGVAAAGLAGLPLTIGFFKDDLFIKTALEQGDAAAVLAALAVALTIAYAARFWFGIFGGSGRDGPGAALGLSLPVTALAALVVVGGLWTAPLEAAFTEAGRWIAHEPVSVHLAYELEPSPTVLLTLAAWGVGAVLALASGTYSPLLARAVARAAPWVGPATWSDRIATGGAMLSNQLHKLEVRDMRDRLTAVLGPTAAFILLGIWAQAAWPNAGTLDEDSAPLAAALVLVAAAALAAARPLSHLAFVLQLSFVGFSLALAFALAFAPDVALVLVLIETGFTLLFLAVISRIRPPVLEKARQRMGSGRGPFYGIAAGGVGAAVAWLALSTPHDQPMALAQLEATERAHAKDAVTAILADFRGLDTAGELTVLVVAIIGAAAIVWGRRT